MALERARSLSLFKISNFFILIECIPCLSLFPPLEIKIFDKKKKNDIIHNCFKLLFKFLKGAFFINK
jgi:hypothetical protein